MDRNALKRLTLSALLVTVMLMLGYVESLVPTGVPGVKLGLSNSVLLLAVCWLGIPRAFLLMIVKVLLSGFLFSGVNAMMYAFAGGVLSMLAMSVLHRLDFGLIPVAMAGAVLHNAGQVTLAMVMLRTKGLVYYMGALMLVGLVTGFVTGTVARILIRRIPASMLPKR
jgi:Predicted membrane protein